MAKHHYVLIGGALALLWYCHKQKHLAASTANASAPNAGATYTTQQSAQAAGWWKFGGAWDSSTAVA